MFFNIYFVLVGDGDDRFPVYYGTISGVPCVCMGKRYHFYQGYTPAQTAIPIALMKALGIEMVILSNAAGGINSNFHVGDLMMIKDHISFLGLSGNNPLVIVVYMSELGGSQQRIDGNSLPSPLQRLRRRASQSFPRYGRVAGPSRSSPRRCVCLPVRSLL